MQAIVETLFDTVYLFSVITIGILMIRKSKGNRQFTMFGIMAVLLGSGDAFHLVPRAVALCTTGLENFTVQLGLGKWITSITMTIFYVVLYHIWRERCNGVQREHNKKLNNGLPILHKVPPKRDYGRYFCIMAEKGGTSHEGLTEKLSLFFHAKKQEVNAYGR